MNKLEAGNHLGKIFDYCMQATKDFEPRLVIQFELESGHYVLWGGTFKNEKAREIAFRTLKTLNFHGRIEDLANGKESGCLDTDKQVQLVVEFEEYNGKSYPKVQWVNEVGGGALQNRLDRNETAKLCAHLNLNGELMKAGFNTSSASGGGSSQQPKGISAFGNKNLSNQRDPGLDNIPF